MTNVMRLSKSLGHDYGPWLPNVVRIIDIVQANLPGDGVDNRARVVGCSFLGVLAWRSRQIDIRLQPGQLVRVAWPAQLRPEFEAVPVECLMPLGRIDHQVNLFETVPPSWGCDRELVERASQLWGQLPAHLRGVFNQLLGDDQRFYQYVVAPCEAGVGSERCGVFRHSVTLADTALQMASLLPAVDTVLLLLACLIHDVGQIDALECQHGVWCLSAAGERLGAQELLKGRLGAVFERLGREVPVIMQHRLWHTLFAQGSFSASPEQPLHRWLENDVLQIAHALAVAGDVGPASANLFNLAQAELPRVALP